MLPSSSVVGISLSIGPGLTWRQIRARPIQVGPPLGTRELVLELAGTENRVQSSRKPVLRRSADRSPGSVEGTIGSLTTVDDGSTSAELR